jgi:hypothetical protein
MWSCRLFSTCVTNQPDKQFRPCEPRVVLEPAVDDHASDYEDLAGLKRIFNNVQRLVE